MHAWHFDKYILTYRGIMAELEVAKHTKNLIGAAAGKHPWMHKARDILLEMAIIVFAVSISIWFHSLGEHRHEQAQVRTFLVGLKRDIQSDMLQLGEVVAFHHEADRRYAVLSALDPAAVPPAQFEDMAALIGSNNFLIARQGRYDGFKMSGKLINIEDDRLLERITEFYEYAIPKLKLSSGGWLSMQAALDDYLAQATDDDASLAARYRALTSPKGKIRLTKMQTYPQLYERAAALQSEAKAIIAAIDVAYPDQAGAH